MIRSKSIDTFVDVNLDGWDDEELIGELEDRGYSVEVEDRGYSVEEKGGDTEVLDDIYELYKEWANDQGDRDNRFDKAMRKFFEKYLNKVSV
jgi:hypothetical protein